MQIILTKDVDKLGYANDIVDVKPGYANNFDPDRFGESGDPDGAQSAGGEPQTACS